MMCPPSDDDRSPRNYYGYGANTLWFQYILCQQESIPSLACWLFTSGWNQADFGQYYLYDNLLGDDDVGIAGLDGDLLPLLVLGGGLGGGSAYGGPAHGGGHAMYRREVIDKKACPNGENEDGTCKARKGRSTPCPNGENDDGSCIEVRKRRSTPCPNGKNADGTCKARKARSSTCSDGENEDGTCKDRKRRSTPCPHGKNLDGTCKARHARSSTCTDGENEDGTCKARKRRSTPCPHGKNEDETCKDRKRRSLTCPNGEVLVDGRR